MTLWTYDLTKYCKSLVDGPRSHEMYNCKHKRQHQIILTVLSFQESAITSSGRWSLMHLFVLGFPNRNGPNGRINRTWQVSLYPCKLVVIYWLLMLDFCQEIHGLEYLPCLKIFVSRYAENHKNCLNHCQPVFHVLPITTITLWWTNIAMENGHR